VSPSPTPHSAPSRGAILLAATVIMAAGGAAYHNSFDGPFVFDDLLAIPENPTIRRLWPLTDVLLPPRGEGLSVEGRPVLNLTLALNYAVGGTAVRGYHVVNLAIHLFAALTLFGLLRCTFLLPRFRERFGAAALPLATVIATLWAVHPLTTAAVTYVIQRAEALMALCYLFTLYAFVRSIGRAPAPPTPSTINSRNLWSALAVLTCLVGMATKEVMVSAPLLVLLFDRLFVAGSFRAAWQHRGRLHLALFSTWLLLGALVVSTGTRGGTAGFGINVTPWAYALTQFESVTRYVGLALWPSPLIFDYGVAWVEHVADLAPYAAVLLALFGGTLFAWRRAPAIAWLGLLFFAVLSPTSSIVPGNRQTMAEHRMYLPLAAVLTLVVGSGHLFATTPARRRLATAAALCAMLACTALAIRRNHDYRSALALYEDTVAKRPGNGFAHYNLAKVYADAGRHPEAVAAFEHSVRLMPSVAHTHFNLANSLVALGRTANARAHFETALRLDPRYPKAHFNLGVLLVGTGDRAAAVDHFRRAVELAPGYLEARSNLGSALLELGRLDEAAREFTHVVAAQPDSVEARFGLGTVFLLQKRWAAAAQEFETVLRLRPDLTVARERLVLARAGR
jgi:tetratricopeptide (TPR) repeat protein